MIQALIRILLIALVFIVGVSLGFLLPGLDEQASQPPTVQGETELEVLSAQTEQVTDLLRRGDLDAAMSRLALNPAQRSSVRLLSDRQRASLMQAYRATGSPPLWLLFQEARLLIDSGDVEAAFSLLSEASIAVRSAADEAALISLLQEMVNQLAATEQYSRLDALLTDMTLALPEQADFYMQLARLRIKDGRPQDALQVLAQIENHGRLGAKARQMMTAIEDNQRQPATGVVSLQQNGNQYLVAATLDSEQSVQLLIDTGAALTIVDADLLLRMGYDLSAAPTARFVTAGGTVVAPVLTLESIQIGQLSLGPLKVGALTMSLPDNAGGLLGMNVLGQYEFFIDQQRRELHLVR